MDYLYAFLCGGVLCAAGQVLIDKTKLTPARILTGYVVLGVLLSALGLYQPLVDLAGAGATVPLTGFGHALAKGVRKAVGEKGWLGIFTGSISFAALAFEVNGAVIAYGNFIQAVLNFLVMAFVVFCLVKGLNKLHRKKEQAPPPPPQPSNEEKLLTEIRDLLKEKGNG